MIARRHAIEHDLPRNPCVGISFRRYRIDRARFKTLTSSITRSRA